MRKYADVVLSQTATGLAQPVVGASVQILGHVSQTNATIYSDDGVTTTLNPLTTDAQGRYQFYVANGRYDIKITAAGFTTFTLTDIDIHDETDITAPGETPLPGILTFTGANTFTGGVTISTTAYSTSSTGTHSGTETFSGKTNTAGVAIGGPSPWIDVTNPTYVGGATGNGVTDDTAAIQAAVSACPATGGTVFFPGTANSYLISSKITLNTNCWYVGVGKASLITYKTPATDNYPKLFCSGCTNMVVSGLNLSNAVTPTSLILWTNSEATINGQEGLFCIGCQDLEVHDSIFNNLGGAGLLLVRGSRERVHNNIANGNVHYGIYLLSDDSGSPTDDTIYSNTCNNNGSFGNSGFQGRGIVATVAGSILPVVGAINTKIVGNTCNGNALYGIEVYRGAIHTEIGWNTTTGNGLGGIHEYNNTFSNVHHNNSYGNGLPNVPNESGGTLPGITGYCIRQGGGYYSTLANNDCYGNNNGGGNVGQIHLNAENPFANSYGNAIVNNHVRNNLGTGNDIFISNTSTNTFPGAVNAFYKITAYDISRNVLAQATEFSNTPSASSVNLITWTPVANATSYVVCRGTSSGTESNGYIAYGNAFLDQNGAALFTCSPPGSGTTITGVTLTNLATAADTYGVLLMNNNLIGTTTSSSLAYSAFNTIAIGNITTASTTTNLPVTAALIPSADQMALGNSAQRWSGAFYLANFFRSGGSFSFPDIFGNGSARPVIGDSNGVGLNAHFDVPETTAPSGASGEDRCYGDSATHTLKCSYNNGSFLSLPQVIAASTAAMTTASITTLTCGTVVTVAATGVAATDSIIFNNSGSVSTTDGVLSLRAWPTTNNVNFQYCNPTAGSVTPAAATLNWRVVR